MSRFNDEWRPYVSVAQRRVQAMREINKLRKNGEDIQPVEIEGRTIARSFWGKGWCTHLESFGDYSNRLPRGRTYVRNGSVCHLVIRKGTVEAIVSGSDLYRVRVSISSLKKKKWNALKRHCTGKIGSLIELLQGNLSEEIMRIVVDRKDGLFPLPGEIKYECDCPDWADMCKHIAAIMYGIGARLDTQPDLLFTLRGVDHQELIAADAAAAAAIAGSGSQRARRRSFAGKDLEGVFGVELVDSPDVATRKKTARRKTAKQKPMSATKQKKEASKPPTRKSRSSAPFKPTARSVAALRRRLGMAKAEFARAIGVSPATVTNWETATGALNIHAKSLVGLSRLNSSNKSR